MNMLIRSSGTTLVPIPYKGSETTEHVFEGILSETIFICTGQIYKSQTFTIFPGLKLTAE